MGLISNAIRSLTTKHERQVVYQFPDAPIREVPYGDQMMNVYTYDGRPLTFSGLRRGSAFVLDVLPGVWKMKSVYTGTQRQSTGALAYQGMPIGFMEYGNKQKRLVMLSDDYAHVTVHARWIDTHKDGWPIICLMVPRKIE